MMWFSLKRSSGLAGFDVYSLFTVKARSKTESLKFCPTVNSTFTMQLSEPYLDAVATKLL